MPRATHFKWHLAEVNATLRHENISKIRTYSSPLGKTERFSGKGRIKMKTPWICSFVLSALLGVVPLAANDGTYEIGTVGATFGTGNWERQQLSASLGDDQFLRVGEDLFLVIFENFSLFEQRADSESFLEDFLNTVGVNLQEVTIDPEVGFERYDQITRTTRRFIGSVSGLNFAYQLDLLSTGDGVGYLVMSWTTTDKAETLYHEIESAILSFQFPGPSSEWHAKAQPTEHSFDFRPWTVSLTYRESVFTENDSIPRERHSLYADEGSLAVHLFVDDLEGTLDEITDQIRDAAQGSDDYEELLRRELDSAIGPAMELLLRGRVSTTTELAIAVIELGDDRWIDLRMVTESSSGHRSELWNQLLASLRVEKEAEIDAFPRAIHETEPQKSDFLSEPARSLLEGSRFVSSAEWSHQVLRTPNGDLIFKDDQEVLRRPATAQATSQDSSVIFRSEETLSGSIHQWNDRLLLVEPGKESRWLEEDSLRQAGFRADRVSTIGDNLLIARSREENNLVGFDGLLVAGETVLWVRTPDGEESRLTELLDQRIDALGGGNQHALVFAIPRRSGSRASASFGSLISIDTTSGAQSNVGDWESVETIVSLGENWMVTGTPKDGSNGVYEVNPNGRKSKWLTGQNIGLWADDERVLFLSDLCLEEPLEGGRCLYETPRELIAEYGPRFWTFDSNSLNSIAAKTFQEISDPASALAPLTREKVAEITKLAETATRSLTGSTLPLTVAGVDALLASLVYERDLSDQALSLLTLVTTETLLRQEGATWIQPEHPSSGRPGSSGWVLNNAIGIGLHPGDIVLSTLYDEEGWYRPLDQIEKQRRGRTLLVGSDRTVLRDAVHQSTLEGLSELFRLGNAKALTALLKEHSENSSLRGRTYRQLASLGRSEILNEVARSFARSDDPTAEDLTAYHSARLATSSSEEVPTWINDLRQAIERFPEEYSLYLILGSVYEKSTLPNKSRLAIACYEKVLELSSYGDSAETATAALARLEGQP